MGLGTVLKTGPHEGRVELSVICKLIEGELDPTVYAVDKDIKKPQPQGGHLGDTTCHWPLLGHRAMDHNTMFVAIQQIPYPLNSPLFKSISFQFRD